MKSARWCLAIAAIYFATGLFVVPANEKAVVRRFGRAIWPILGSGLHYNLPWPMARVDRINFHEVRTLSLGDFEADPNFLQPTSVARPLTFLTGDKNLLSLRITVQYRISEEDIAAWLYGSAAPLAQLQAIVETTAADLVSRSGVDFVHTQGLAEFNNRLLQDVRRQIRSQHFGCEVEQVAVDRVDPPARVKAEFLDVSNARADMARSIHEARGYAEQKQAESQADARKIVDTAERDSRARVSAARGSADRFVALVEQIQRDSEAGDRSYATSRELVTNRLTLDALRSALAKAKLKVVLDGERPFDLTFPK